jgi:hypothetical protein
MRGLRWSTPCQWSLARTSEFAAADSMLWRKAKTFVAISRAKKPLFLRFAATFGRQRQGGAGGGAYCLGYGP